MIKKEHLLYTDKVDSNKDIMVISEMHFSDARSLGKISRIINMASKERVSHIIIPGDLYNGNDETIYYNDSRLCGFLNYLSQIAPVYYVQGNSEQDSRYLPGFMYEPRFFLSPFVHFLGKFHLGSSHETFVSYDNFNVVGLSLDERIYSLMDKSKPRAIASYYGDFFSSLLANISESQFNILICHDPMIGEALSLMDISPDLFDLIITGHKHGGEYPDELKTILTLSTEFMNEAYPKYQNGFYDIDGIGAKMFVGSGVTEYVLENKDLELDHEGVIDFIRIRKI